MSVYFVICAQSSAVKIGYASNPSKRLHGMGVFNPFPLELAATVPGTMEDEKRLHRALRDWKMCGEWFRWDLITHEIIERAQAGASIDELIDFASGKLFTRIFDREVGCLISEIERAA